MSRCAVLVNDMQYDLVSETEDHEAALEVSMPSVVDLVERARNLGVPIVHLRLVSGRFGSGELLEELVDPRDLIVEKASDNGFFETDLDERLRELGVETVVLAGMHTEICVQITSTDAFHRGYNVVLSPEGVISVREEDKLRALEWLRSYCATVVGAEELLEALAGTRDRGGAAPRAPERPRSRRPGPASPRSRRRSGRP